MMIQRAVLGMLVLWAICLMPCHGEEEAAAIRMARAYATEQGVKKAAVEKGVKEAKWKEDKEAVALCFEKNGRTLCLVVAKKDGPDFTVVDVSRVEGMNLGKMGWGDQGYTRVTTFVEGWRGPEDKWWTTENALCQVRFTTRAWKGKQRYTTSEPLVIRKDLTPWWR